VEGLEDIAVVVDRVAMDPRDENGLMEAGNSTQYSTS